MCSTHFPLSWKPPKVDRWWIESLSIIYEPPLQKKFSPIEFSDKNEIPCCNSPKRNHPPHKHYMKVKLKYFHGDGKQGIYSRYWNHWDRLYSKLHLPLTVLNEIWLSRESVKSAAISSVQNAEGHSAATYQTNTSNAREYSSTKLPKKETLTRSSGSRRKTGTSWRRWRYWSGEYSKIKKVVEFITPLIENMDGDLMQTPCDLAYDAPISKQILLCNRRAY